MDRKHAQLMHCYAINARETNTFNLQLDSTEPPARLTLSFRLSCIILKAKSLNSFKITPFFAHQFINPSNHQIIVTVAVDSDRNDLVFIFICAGIKKKDQTSSKHESVVNTTHIS